MPLQDPVRPVCLSVHHISNCPVIFQPSWCHLCPLMAIKGGACLSDVRGVMCKLQTFCVSVSLLSGGWLPGQREDATSWYNWEICICWWYGTNGQLKWVQYQVIWWRTYIYCASRNFRVLNVIYIGKYNWRITIV